MYIEKLVVEGGFLDGLAITFSSKLNVIIGPRGCGKTSIIELIRFCLGVEGMTDRFNLIAQKHAIGVLGAGRVTVEINNDGEKILLSRSVEESHVLVNEVEKPVILSQNEIEEIGLDQKGKLKIVDMFVNNLNECQDVEDRFYPLVRSVSEEINSLKAEIDTLSNSIHATHEQEDELKRLIEQQKSYLNMHMVAEKDQAALQIATQKLSELKVQKDSCDRGFNFFREIQEKLNDLSSVVQNKGIFSPLGRKSFSVLEKVLESSLHNLLATSEQLSNGVNFLKTHSDSIITEITTVQELVRILRSKLNSVNKGVGEINKRISVIKDLIALGLYHQEMVSTKSSSLNGLLSKRSNFIAMVDNARNASFIKREAVIKKLNSELKPNLKIHIAELGHKSEYAAVISGKLRGSGLQYGSLALSIVESLSPKELVEALERNDVEFICKRSNIQENKCKKVISHLMGQSLTDILTCSIEDSVRFELLDGTEYKPTEHLSMGQRCTVILPILLQQRKRSLLIDQPEDHLDNSFVANTLIPAIINHKSTGQIILTTHNPNIPVLGDAEEVICLGSDGKRGFVKSAQPLDHPVTIGAITTIMEGGAEAFARRAMFYKNIGE